MNKIFIVISIIWSSFILISIIDHGQTYVALSRVVSLDGLFLAFLLTTPNILDG